MSTPKTSTAPRLWLRLWHLLAALGFAGLLVTGLSMHYAETRWTPIAFPTAVKLHNILGVANGLLWLFFVVMSAATGNLRNYLPRSRHVVGSLLQQVHYYMIGMFRGDAKPFPAQEGQRFNPLQKITYGVAMYVLMPLAIVSGTLLLFPLLAPEQALGHSGLWPMAMLHLTIGYLLTIFLVFHIYMATTGKDM